MGATNDMPKKEKQAEVFMKHDDDNTAARRDENCIWKGMNDTWTKHRLGRMENTD